MNSQLIKPLQKQVLIKRGWNEQPTGKVIVVPDSISIPKDEGIVMDIGRDVASVIPELKVGHKVLFAKALRPVDIDAGIFVIGVEHILAILNWEEPVVHPLANAKQGQHYPSGFTHRNDY